MKLTNDALRSEPLVCIQCGGSHIQTKAWVNSNTNEYISDADGDGENNWCEDCNEATDLVTVGNFVEGQK